MKAWILPFLFLLLSAVFYFNLDKNSSEVSAGELHEILSEYNITLDILELETEDYKKLYVILEDIEPIYLNNQRSISFVDNIGESLNNSDYDSYYGLNVAKGDIYIKLNRKWSGIKVTICHELLHTFYIRSDVTHDIIREQAKQGICYK